MMDRTDRHFRYVLRCLSTHTLLYTEMVTTGAILYGNLKRLLGYHPAEHPIALQLGGDDPTALATCARIGADLGYDEINLNVGCPSDRVQKGRFGAVLMRAPEHVAACVHAMQDGGVPVTVKHRIGVDELDRYEDMERFVRIVAEAQPARFTVHARKAWLQGLSPKQNRNVPPLRHDDVYRLKADHPHLCIETNGGIQSLAEAQQHLEHVDAVMIGRAAVDNPWLFAKADAQIFAQPGERTREQVLQSVSPYLQEHLEQGGRFHHVARHLLHLYRGLPGARRWRRHLTEAGQRADVTAEALLRCDGVGSSG